MSFEFKEEHLAAMIPTNRANAGRWFRAMQEIFPKYDITTPNRIAGFVAQCAHESGEFKTLEENLNYSYEALLRVFPRYFGPGKRNAAEYARKPEKIANYVYMDENRTSKLGNVREGDGWRFRGRGLKQLTGRDNYAAFGRSIGMTAEQAADYVATEKGAIESACWFWKQRNLNPVADAGDIVRMSKIINGGDIGLADRKRRWEDALRILKAPPGARPPAGAPTRVQLGENTLRRGDRGDQVKALQRALKLPADGVFGIMTEATLKDWQRRNGIAANGVAGPDTLSKLLG